MPDYSELTFRIDTNVDEWIAEIDPAALAQLNATNKAERRQSLASARADLAHYGRPYLKSRDPATAAAASDFATT
jgi:hypothetical protein